MNKRDNDKKNFFGLSESEKGRIMNRVLEKANQEQRELVNRHGGIKVLKNYSVCN